MSNIAVVVLAAGLGTRMNSALPKVMHPIAGKPMIQHLLKSVEMLAPERTVVVIGEDMANVVKAVSPLETAIQHQRLGTGHAVMMARDALRSFSGTVLVVYGDTPLLPVDTLRRMVEARSTPPHPAVVVLGFRPRDPGSYGRLVTNGPNLVAIVEAKDATPQERAIGFCNSGVIAVDGSSLFELLDKVGTNNAKGEYYLTDIVQIAVAAGLTCQAIEGDESELLGVNTRVDLTRIEAIVQDTLRRRAMEGGATLIDPGTVYFSADTRIGRDVTIGPFVCFGPGVTVADDVLIRAFCHIEDAHIERGAVIGPYARLRPGARIAADAHIGNFVEVKNATVEAGAKVNHLTYIGDARIGAGANIGAGTITCNYDGFVKGFTDIGAGAFIGSNASLVAPVTIGDGAIIGAGSVIAKDVAANALAITRGPHTEKPNWASTFRERRRAEKLRKASR